jgi:hypothetical protein
VSEIASGKIRIQELVTTAAEGLGIDPKQLVFRWDVLEGFVLPEHEIKIEEKVYVLRIYRGKSSQGLTFTARLVQESVDQPLAFLSELRDPIIGALRKLRRKS